MREMEESATAEMTVEGMDALVGRLVDERFRIVELIGKGTMGTVYRAVQLPLNRAVALKILDSRSGAGRDETFTQRFLVEAALTAKLNHPNTVRVLDYGHTPDGLFFLAMEYLDGETLERVLSRGPLSWRRVVNIGQQMARALREAHDLGVVHRDLKPANVVLLHADDDADFVKVLDFGLVKSFVEGQELEGRAITKKGMLMGSPQYMAPEQGEQNRADPRSDIYSLGTMLYEMLTGAPPFTGRGTMDVLLKHVHEPVRPLVVPAYAEVPPEELIRIVFKCLAKSPMDRFQTIDELLVALQEVPTPARSATQEFSTTDSVTHLPMSGQSIDWVPVRPPVSFPVVGAVLLAAVVGALGTWASLRAGAPTKLRLHLESTPTGATVWVDGKALGVTPLELQKPLGSESRASIQVRLDAPEFVPYEVSVSALAGRVDVAAVLQPVPSPKVDEPVTPLPVVAPPPSGKPEKKKRSTVRNRSTQSQGELKRPLPGAR